MKVLRCKPLVHISRLASCCLAHYTDMHMCVSNSSIVRRLQSSDAIIASEQDSHLPTSINIRLLLAESAFTAARSAHLLHAPGRVTSWPFYSFRACGVFSKLYEVQIHCYSTHMHLVENPGEQVTCACVTMHLLCISWIRNTTLWMYKNINLYFLLV